MSVDDTYNILVCQTCKIGVPVDRIVRHMKDFHGIRMELETWQNLLDSTRMPMNFQEVRNWLSGRDSVEIRIVGIPIMNGFRCILCNYCATGKQVIRNHFSIQHKDASIWESVEKCIVRFLLFELL